MKYIVFVFVGLIAFLATVGASAAPSTKYMTVSSSGDMRSGCSQWVSLYVDQTEVGGFNFAGGKIKKNTQYGVPKNAERLSIRLQSAKNPNAPEILHCNIAGLKDKKANLSFSYTDKSDSLKVLVGNKNQQQFCGKVQLNMQCK